MPATRQISEFITICIFFCSPQIWPQILSACGFLMPAPLLFWRLIPNRRLRLCTLLIPAWIVIMSIVGLLPESRIFGELIGLAKRRCSALFFSSVASRGKRQEGAVNGYNQGNASIGDQNMIIGAPYEVKDS